MNDWRASPNPIQEAHDLNKVIEEMASLQKHPGWLRFMEYLDNEERSAFDAIMKQPSGDLMIRAATAYVVTKKIKDLVPMWARTHLDRLKAVQDGK